MKNASFYVPMFAFALWNVFAMVQALRWSSLPKGVFEIEKDSRKMVLFNSMISILLALGVFTYANETLTVTLKVPKLAVNSMLSWQLVSNLIIASYAWNYSGGKIHYDDWRRSFTRLVSLANVVLVLMTIFGVDFINKKIM